MNGNCYNCGEAGRPARLCPKQPSASSVKAFTGHAYSASSGKSFSGKEQKATRQDSATKERDMGNPAIALEEGGKEAREVGTMRWGIPTQSGKGGKLAY